MSSRSVLTGGDQRAAASSSSALYSKPWRSSLFPWIGFFTPKPSENETTFCWGHLSEADTPLDAYLLDWVTRQPLRREWFFEERDGNCRLMGSFAVRLAETAHLWRRAVGPVAEWVARAFWSTIRRPDAPIATRLTQNNKREAKGAPPLPSSIRAPRRENLCRGCGKTIQDGRANCARCAVGDATTNMAAAALIGRQTAHSPEAQLKRANTQRKNALAQHAWKPSENPPWLTEKFYSANVQPLLAAMSSSAIARQISVSRWYAGRIREGYRPHPRHWQALAELVGVALSRTCL